MSLTNLFVGYAAGSDPAQKVDAVNSVAIGAGAFTTADNQVMLGNDAVTETVLRGTVTVSGARAIQIWEASQSFFVGGAGPAAEPTGAGNTAFGPGALDAVTTGENNVAVGSDALGAADTGSSNVAVGAGAGEMLTTGTGNVFVGRNAGQDPAQKVDAVNSVAIGAGTFTTADNQVMLGNDAVTETVLRGTVTVNGARAIQIWEASQSFFVGGAGPAAEPSSAGNTAFAPGALDAVTTGGNNVAVGSDALGAVDTGSSNVAVGAGAGEMLTTGTGSTFIGSNAGGSATAQAASGSNMTAIGADSFCERENEIALGNDLVEDIKACGTTMFRGYVSNRQYFFAGAGNRSSGNLVGYGANVGIGELALANVSTGSKNVAIGEFAMNALTTSTGSVAIGPNAMEKSNGIDVVAIGWATLQEALGAGVGDTAMGRRALGKATEHRNNTAVGDSAAWQYQGSGGVFAGYCVAELMQTGNAAIVIGRAAGRYRKSGERPILIGEEAGSFYNAPDVNIEANQGAVDAGDRVIAIGYRALAQTTGSDHVALGDLAGYLLTAGSGSVFIGSGAGNQVDQKVDAVNSVAIGNGAFTTADNQVVLGNASITATVLRGNVTGPRSLTIAGTGTPVTINSTNNSGRHLWLHNAGAVAGSIGATGGGIILQDSGSTTRLQVTTAGVSVTGTLKQNVLTVATLPAAAIAGAGARSFVSDAAGAAFASVVAGGGSDTVPVYSDGTSWRIG